MAPSMAFIVGLHGGQSSGNELAGVPRRRGADGASPPSHEVERDFRHARLGSGCVQFCALPVSRTFFFHFCHFFGLEKGKHSTQTQMVLHRFQIFLLYSKESCFIFIMTSRCPCIFPRQKTDLNDVYLCFRQLDCFVMQQSGSSRVNCHSIVETCLISHFWFKVSFLRDVEQCLERLEVGVPVEQVVIVMFSTQINSLTFLSYTFWSSSGRFNFVKHSRRLELNHNFEISVNSFCTSRRGFRVFER